jgi:hypothetical protein
MVRPRYFIYPEFEERTLFLFGNFNNKKEKIFASISFLYIWVRTRKLLFGGYLGHILYGEKPVQERFRIR